MVATLPSQLHRFSEILQGSSEIAEQTQDPTSRLSFPTPESLATLDQIATVVREIDTYFSACRAQVEENLSFVERYKESLASFDFSDPVIGSILAQIALNTEEPLPLRIPALMVLRHYPETICSLATQFIGLLNDSKIVEECYVIRVLTKVAPRIENELLQSLEGAEEYLRSRIYQAVGYNGWRAEFAIPILYQGLSEPGWPRDFAVGSLGAILTKDNCITLVTQHDQHSTSELDYRSTQVKILLMNHQVDNALLKAEELKLKPGTINFLEAVQAEQIETERLKSVKKYYSMICDDEAE